MNIYDEASKFAKDFASTPECIRMKTAQDKLRQDPDKYAKAQKYLTKQMGVQTRQMMGQSLSQDEIRDFNQETMEILSVPEIAEYLQAQMAFARMVQDVMKIFNEAVGIDMNLFGPGF